MRLPLPGGSTVTLGQLQHPEHYQSVNGPEGVAWLKASGSRHMGYNG